VTRIRLVLGIASVVSWSCSFLLGDLGLPAQDADAGSSMPDAGRDAGGAVDAGVDAGQDAAVPECVDDFDCPDDFVDCTDPLCLGGDCFLSENDALCAAGTCDAAFGCTGCDLYDQSGCAADERCTLDCEGGEVCADDGPVGVGAPCVPAEGDGFGACDPEIDDCEAGSLCRLPAVAGAVARCNRVCLGDDDCGNAADDLDSICLHGVTLGGASVDLCSVRCDPMTQDCVIASDACYVNENGGRWGSHCSPEGADREGDPCVDNAECAAGLGCGAALGLADDVCVRLCDLGEVALPCPGEGTCEDVGHSVVGVCRCAGGDCAAGETCCDGTCVDTLASDAHCGACDAACGGAEGDACVDGGCECAGDPQCSGDATDTCCPGIGCTNTAAELAHCGGCGSACTASEGNACDGGICECEGGAACAGTPADTCCAGAGCIDTTADLANCGACALVCTATRADSCDAGSCECAGDPECGGGFNDRCCPGAGCIDLETDAAHCGGCAAACVAAEADRCFGGDCRCGAAASCAGTPADTCCGALGCVDTLADVAHCGGCGALCAAAEGNACSAGSCECDGGPACAGTSVDTCCPGAGCVDTETDELHCGGCFLPCGGTCVGALCT